MANNNFVNYLVLSFKVSMPDGYQEEVEQTASDKSGNGIDGIVGIDIYRREAH